jgi:hypothetical protein
MRTSPAVMPSGKPLLPIQDARELGPEVGVSRNGDDSSDPGTLSRASCARVSSSAICPSRRGFYAAVATRADRPPCSAPAAAPPSGSTQRHQPRYRHGDGPKPAPDRAARPPGSGGGVNRHSGSRKPCRLNGRRASLDGCALAAWRQPRSPPDNPGHRTLNAAPWASSARTWRQARTTRPARHRARSRRLRAGAADPAARKPDPAAIPHRQLFRTPFCIPADTGTPRTRGMRRQCPE